MSQIQKGLLRILDNVSVISLNGVSLMHLKSESEMYADNLVATDV